MPSCPTTDLARRAAHRARGPGHEDGLALLQTDRAEEPHVRRHAGHAQDAQSIGGVRQVAFEHLEALPAADLEFLPPRVGEDEISLLVVRVPGPDHAAHGAAGHDVADGKR